MRFDNFFDFSGNFHQSGSAVYIPTMFPEVVKLKIRQ